MKERHYLVCEAAICNDDPNKKYKKEVIWKPGEIICKRKPYDKFQNIQIEINKCVEHDTFKKMDESYTAHELETHSI